MSTAFKRGGRQVAPKPEPEPLGYHTYRVRFHGDGWEYTRIWWVNILLIIITLGIYYPWARVRSRRYLIGSFRIGGTTGAFDYLAPPRAILFGTLLLVLLAAAGYVILVTSAEFGLAGIGYFSFSVLLLALLPWLLVRSMAFNARYTCYRRLCFSCRREYWPLYKVLFVALLSLAALGDLSLADLTEVVDGELAVQPLFLVYPLPFLLVLP